MTQIIILTGAHGTGKTSIAEDYSKKTGIPFFESQAAACHAELGLSPSHQLEFFHRMKVQNLILGRWMEQYTIAQRTGGIFDRCPLDFSAYVLADVPRVLDHRMSLITEDYINCCLGIAKSLPLVFLCEPHGEAVGDRGSERPDAENTAYVRHIQVLVAGMLHSAGIDHSIVGAGPVSQRVDYIGRVLSSKFDDNAQERGKPPCPQTKMS